MRHGILWSPALWLWLPGVGIVSLVIYAVVPRLYYVITWEHTTGTVVDVTSEYSEDEWTYYEKAEFIDPDGTKWEAIAFSGYGDRDDVSTGEVTILYETGNPKNATIIKLGDFLIIVMLPFAALLIYLGWPFGRDVDVSSRGKINVSRKT